MDISFQKVKKRSGTESNPVIHVHLINRDFDQEEVLEINQYNSYYKEFKDHDNYY